MESQAVAERMIDAGAATRTAVGKASAYLQQRQSPQGYWVGDLQADVSVGAGYIPLLHFLGVTPPPGRVEKIVGHIRRKQKPDGSWPSFADGPGDLNVTVQTYFAMKLAGVSAGEAWLRKARDFIRLRGGLAHINAITRVWLALFGQVDWSRVPSIPPGLLLLPERFPFNIYDFSSWSRATIVALMAISAKRPICAVPGSATLSEFPPWDAGKLPGASTAPLFSPEWLFLLLDLLLKLWDKSPVKPGRRTALKRVEEWILAHQEDDGSWGGILLPWVYSLIALKGLGYPTEHPAIVKGVAGLEGFFVEDAEGLWLQPATSPVWDTAWSIIALSESGLPEDDPHLRRAARWLLSREVRRPGDWKVKNPQVEPGCWSFEFENSFYPDLDDTAVVPRALLRVRLDEEGEKEQAISRAAEWIRRMQSADGGWAAFDRDNNRRILAHIPFADFITPLDPTCADVTAHVLEFFADAAVFGTSRERAVEYLRRTQEPDGSWYGRWGVNYIYGTGLALAALAAVPVTESTPWIRRAAAWLIAHQNQDGGWGESCRSYEDPSARGHGPSTASQTAWALLGLLAPGVRPEGEGESIRRALRRGVEYLVSTQAPDGAWAESAHTGTGFPRAFYLRYDQYRVVFPLLALALVQNRKEALTETSEERFARIQPSERILLISHCLRRTDTCTATYGAWGLECRNCGSNCAIRRLSEAAKRMGYRGVCVAPGGSMAIKFVAAMRPRGIVAVACAKELAEGIEAVRGVSGQDGDGPAIVIVPLLKEGCHDTEVDVEQGLKTLALGIGKSQA